MAGTLIISANLPNNKPKRIINPTYMINLDASCEDATDSNKFILFNSP
jgi:hypothetical protein